MINMPIFHCIAEYNFWPVFTYHPYDPQLVFSIVYKETICKLQIFTDGNSQYPSGLCSFNIPDFSRAPGSQFTSGQVHNSNFFAICNFLGNGGTCTQFCIIWVCPKD